MVPVLAETDPKLNLLCTEYTTRKIDTLKKETSRKLRFKLN